jgi:hypothetical protein
VRQAQPDAHGRNELGAGEAVLLEGGDAGEERSGTGARRQLEDQALLVRQARPRALRNVISHGQLHLLACVASFLVIKGGQLSERGGR